MKKSGFTMIELIFVIVILGILAAVAIPKLAATRDDAKVAAIAEQVQGAVGEIPAYITAHGGDVNATPLTTESQVLNQMVSQGKANKVSDSKVEIYGTDGSTVCFTLETNDTSLLLETNNTSDNACARLTKMVKDVNYTIAGSSASF